jgi:uncharacterized metal-binding protein
MPSGQTHDRITLWSLPVVTGLAIAFTRSGNLTLLISGGFLFSGLMLSPDLDLNSRPFMRWGWLRWIWIPYQKSMRHRSVFSHGPIIGTTLRILYLACWIAWFSLLILLGVQLVQDLNFNWQDFSAVVGRWLSNYWIELIALFVGLELGAMSHSLSDWTNSAYKKMKKPKRKSRRSSKK